MAHPACSSESYMKRTSGTLHRFHRHAFVLLCHILQHQFPILMGARDVTACRCCFAARPCPPSCICHYHHLHFFTTIPHESPREIRLRSGST